MWTTITQRDTAEIPPDSDRAGNLDFGVAVVRGKPYMYFRIGSIVAQRSGLRRGDKVAVAWNPETGAGVIKPHPDGWTLQSGNMKIEDNPPLTVRITRKKHKELQPYLKKVGECQNVKAVANSLEFTFPEGTIFGEPEKETEAGDELFERHKRLVERERRPTRKDETPDGMFDTEGKPYRRRASDRASNGH